MGDSKRQGGLVCYSPWGFKESDVTEQLDDNNWIMPSRLNLKKIKQNNLRDDFVTIMEKTSTNHIN